MSTFIPGGKKGFMPVRIEVTRIPSSYAIRSHGRPPRLNLEQIWEEKERDQKRLPAPEKGSD